MALSEGTVSCMLLADDFGFISIRTAPDRLEPFILWYGSTRSPGPMALWIPELSIALARGLNVAIVHGDASAYIDSIRIDAP